MDDLIPQTPEESLYAFMDGELDSSHEQPLFDALAADTSLRGEMKDLLSIRSAVHRDVVPPPADMESRILGGIITPPVGASTAASATASATASTTTFLQRLASGMRSPLVTGMAGIVIGMALTYGFMQTTSDTASAIAPPTTGPAALTMTVPLPPGGLGAASTPVREIVYVYRDRPVASAQTSATALSEPPEQPIETPNVNREAPVGLFVEPLPSAPVAMSDVAAFGQIASAPAVRFSPASTFLEDVQFRLRRLPSGIGSASVIPASISQSFMPNTALGISLPLNHGQRIGIEAATESFQQSFDDVRDGRQVTFTQTPTLFWLGATYSYQPLDYLLVRGLRPYVEMMAGAVFAQGPVGHGGIGLVYRPAGAISLQAGINGSALLYRHAGTWYSSTKWGLTYGISVDLGRVP